MSDVRNPAPNRAAQIFSAAAIAFAVFILIVLAQRVTTTLVLWQQMQEVQREISAGRAESERLEQRKLYVQSPEYIESVARHDMKMGKPGEVSVIAVPAPTAQPTGAPK